MVANQLPGLHDRMAGSNRYATSVEIAKKFFPSATKAYLASGEVFADALVAGSIAGGEGAPILLVSRQGTPQVVLDYLKNSHVDTAIITGGASTVPTVTEGQLTGN